MTGEGARRSFRTFSCKSCGGEVKIKAEGWTLTVACPYCGDISDPNDYRLLQKAAEGITFKAQLPLGSRGKVKGHTYEVIGAMEKAEGDWRWREYLLFNPFQGYRWLVENQGHWTFVEMTMRRPKAHGIIVNFQGNRFRKYSEGQAVVRCVIGEFYWRVRVGDTAQGVDYVHAPFMLSEERSNSEQSWSIGEYIDVADVRKAFGISDDHVWSMPGVNPAHRPSPYRQRLIEWGITWAGFTVLLIVLQAFFKIYAPNRQVFEKSFTAGRMVAVEKTPSFQLEGSLDNLEARLYSNVSNGWLGVEWGLVNEDTQEVKEFETSVSYYSGYDSDGYWSEGSNFADQTVTDIKNGSYHLNVSATWEPYNVVGESPRPTQEYRLVLVRGTGNLSNFLIAWILLTLPPLILWALHYSFQKQKWSNSDYSPYGSE